MHTSANGTVFGLDVLARSSGSGSPTHNDTCVSRSVVAPRGAIEPPTSSALRRTVGEHPITSPAHAERVAAGIVLWYDLTSHLHCLLQHQDHVSDLTLHAKLPKQHHRISTQAARRSLWARSCLRLSARGTCSECLSSIGPFLMATTCSWSHLPVSPHWTTCSGKFLGGNVFATCGL